MLTSTGLSIPYVSGIRARDSGFEYQHFYNFCFCLNSGIRDSLLGFGDSGFAAWDSGFVVGDSGFARDSGFG